MSSPRFVQFIGAQGTPQAGKPVFVNPQTVGVVCEGAGSTDARPVTLVQCGGFPTLVAGSIRTVLSALSDGEHAGT